jgi:hypothetical protein
MRSNAYTARKGRRRFDMVANVVMGARFILDGNSPSSPLVAAHGFVVQVEPFGERSRGVPSRINSTSWSAPIACVRR